MHRNLGPGLLESTYEQCLCHELAQRKTSFKKQVSLPVNYKSIKLDCGYRLDLLIEDKVIVELKCIESILSIHHAQILTYMKLADIKVGLLINFNVEQLTKGIKRFSL